MPLDYEPNNRLKSSRMLTTVTLLLTISGHLCIGYRTLLPLLLLPQGSVIRPINSVFEMALLSIAITVLTAGYVVISSAFEPVRRRNWPHILAITVGGVAVPFWVLAFHLTVHFRGLVLQD